MTNGAKTTACVLIRHSAFVTRHLAFPLALDPFATSPLKLASKVPTAINTVTYSAPPMPMGRSSSTPKGGRKLARGERFLRTPGDGTTTTPPWRGGRTGVPVQILSEGRLPLSGRVGQVGS